LSLLVNSPSPPDGPCVSVGDKFPNDLVLRILPLGASIVYGQDSSDGNGFREDLRKLLIANGASVNYVGELQSGTMLDNDVSGFRGYYIGQITPKLENALPWLPNVVIIHAGKLLGFYTRLRQLSSSPLYGTLGGTSRTMPSGLQIL
jgi:hypothetical protein